MYDVRGAAVAGARLSLSLGMGGGALASQWPLGAGVRLNLSMGTGGGALAGLWARVAAENIYK